MNRASRECIEVNRMNLTGDTADDDAYYRLCFVLRGRLSVVTAAGSFQAGQGDVFVLQMRMAHRFYPINGTSCLCVRFSREVFFTNCLPGLEGYPLVNSFFIRDENCRGIGYLHYMNTPQEIRSLFDKMMRESIMPDAHTQRLLCSDLLHLLLELSRKCMVNTTLSESPNSRMLQRMIDYMVTHYQTATLETMAQRFCYHPNSVTAILKKGTGKTFLQLLSQIRMSQAARLLREEQLSAQETAERCGYRNMSNFYTRFKDCYGMTPGEYVRMTRQ